MGKLIRSTFIALAAAMVASFMFSAVAGAQNNGPYVGNQVTTTQPPEVKSETYVPAAAKSSAAPAAAPEVQANRLAFTGSDATSMALVGVVAVLVGGSILLVRRRSVS